MTRPQHTSEALLRKLLDRVDKDPTFTPEEYKLILEMIKAWRGMLAFGVFTGWVVGTFLAFAAAAVAWHQLTDLFKKWLSS